jgi:hypothetical protein
LTRDETHVFRSSMQWVDANLPRGSTILIDDTFWVDLTQEDFEPVIWFYKLDLDPAIARRFPNWRSLDYVISTGTMRGQTVKGSPLTQVIKAVKNSRRIAVFGRGPERIEVREVGRHAGDRRLSQRDSPANGLADSCRTQRITHPSTEAGHPGGHNGAASIRRASSGAGGRCAQDFPWALGLPQNGSRSR